MNFYFKTLIIIFCIFVNQLLAAPVVLPVDVAAAGANWTGIESSAFGLNIDDADIPAGGDAYDNYFIVTINGAPHVPGNNADQSTLTSLVDASTLGTAITGAAVDTSGVQATQQYLFYNNVVGGAPTARLMMTLNNTTATTQNILVAISGNLGSDSSTLVRSSSSGDVFFDANDVWGVSSDDAVTPSDPALVHVIQGPSCVRSAPVFAGVFGEGYVTSYEFTLEAGETKRVVAFSQLSDTNGNAAIAAVPFNTIAAIDTAKLFDDLTSDQRSSLVNFDFTDCDGDYRFLVNDAITKVNKIKLGGKGGKTAKDAATAADDQAQKYSSTLDLRTGQTEENLLDASSLAVNRVKAAARAAKTSASDFEVVRAAARRSLKRILNRIVDE